MGTGKEGDSRLSSGGPSIEGQDWGATHSTAEPFRLPHGDLVDPAEQARVYEALFHVSAPLEHLGRYAVIRRLGSGGMGTVLEAFDRTLDRRVAVKLLHADIGDQQRLLREARALAKLSHPNVVQIYEVGEPEGRAFIAMELVTGTSLREWMRQEPRPNWRRCRDMFLQAGRGLAAAHERGLIHRDFKPDNVLVGTDGRARVADFGLARLVHLQPEDATGQTMDGDRSSERITAPQGIVPLTKTGAILGTIAYMAPEQMRGQKVDARADQFSFCVALYEALYGERPFEASTLMGRVVALEEELSEPESVGAAPRWLHRLLVRGLARDPGDRFEDMQSLLRELSRPRGRAWKALSIVAVLAGCLGVGSMLASGPARACELDQSALGDAWNPSRRESLRATFAAAGPVAEQSVDIVEQSLDDWGEAWVASLRSSCEATRIEGTQSEALLDRRSGCLERQRRESRAIIDLLVSPDGAGTQHSLEVLDNLPDVESCGGSLLDQMTHPMPTDAYQRESILATFEQLSRAKALAAMSRLDDAEALTVRLDATARSLDYLPLTLEVRLMVAQLSWWRGHFDAGVSSLQAVIHETEIAGLDELSATIRTEFARKVVGQWGESRLQAFVLSEAETAVARVGRAGDPREVDLAVARAAWTEDSGEYEEALTQYRSIMKTARARGDLVRMGRIQQRMARVLIDLGRFDDAQSAYLDARSWFTEVYGPSSPDHARIELELAYLELERGGFEIAEAHLRNLRSRYSPLLEVGSELSNMVELAEAKLAFIRGDLERASASFDRLARLGDDTVRRAEAWQALGVIRFYQGDMEHSIAAYRQAKLLFLRTLGPGHPDIGLLDSNLGESLAANGDHREALASFGEALDTLESKLPPDHPDLALPYKARGQSRLALGDLARARKDLERALRIHGLNPAEPIEQADVEFTLARALQASGEQQRALTLAEAARSRSLEFGRKEQAAIIETWIEEHS